MTQHTLGSSQLFKRVLSWGAILIGGIAVIASVLGYLVVGQKGLVSALIGASMALIFVSLTALSVWIGGKFSLGGFFGMVMGGWLLKLVLFLVLVGVLKHATFINGPTLFLTLVASILGSLALDSLVFFRARLPMGEQ
jgi:hypothetical protein